MKKARYIAIAATALALACAGCAPRADAGSTGSASAPVEQKKQPERLELALGQEASCDGLSFKIDRVAWADEVRGATGDANAQLDEDRRSYLVAYGTVTNSGDATAVLGSGSSGALAASVSVGTANADAIAVADVLGLSTTVDPGETAPLAIIASVPDADRAAGGTSTWTLRAWPAADVVEVGEETFTVYGDDPAIVWTLDATPE